MGTMTETWEDKFRQKRVQEPVNGKDFLSTTSPVSRVFGLDRGTPIDRYYIEHFLDEYEDDRIVKGSTYTTLEIGGITYSKRMAQRYEDISFNCEILDHSKGQDLTDVSTLKKDYYDLFICTQTFNFIYDVKEAIVGAYYTLKPGGTLLATVAGAITPISRYDMDRWGHFWGFTDLSAKKIFSEVFGVENVSVSIYGNALAATAFVQGVAQEELKDINVLDERDSDYQVLLGIKCLKN